MTLGFLVSPLLQSRLDCKYINMIFLSSMSVSMLGLGLSFLRPSLGPALSIPCLVVAGASYGLGVGPVPYIHSYVISLHSEGQKHWCCIVANIQGFSRLCSDEGDQEF